ncbi:formylglycine-generating enzyme family protein, partial [Tautonia sociabilis]
MTFSLSHGRTGAALLACALLAAAAPSRGQEASAPEEMKPYTETIPGTDLSFEMVPIPGGTFLMGSPEDEPDRLEHEGPQHPVTVGPFWMGKHEVTWDEYDEFAFQFDLKRKQREGVKADDQPEGEALSQREPKWGWARLTVSMEGEAPSWWTGSQRQSPAPRRAPPM